MWFQRIEKKSVISDKSNYGCQCNLPLIKFQTSHFFLFNGNSIWTDHLVHIFVVNYYHNQIQETCCFCLPNQFKKTLAFVCQFRLKAFVYQVRFKKPLAFICLTLLLKTFSFAAQRVDNFLSHLSRSNYLLFRIKLKFQKLNYFT